VFLYLYIERFFIFICTYFHTEQYIGDMKLTIVHVFLTALAFLIITSEGRSNRNRSTGKYFIYHLNFHCSFGNFVYYFNFRNGLINTMVNNKDRCIIVTCFNFYLFFFFLFFFIINHCQIELRMIILVVLG
jgi:hypothetical protein